MQVSDHGYSFPLPNFGSAESLLLEQTELRLNDRVQEVAGAYKAYQRTLAREAELRQASWLVNKLNFHQNTRLEQEISVLKNNLLYSCVSFFQSICDYAYVGGCAHEFVHYLHDVSYLTEYNPRTDSQIMASPVEALERMQSVCYEAHEHHAPTHLLQANLCLKLARQLLSCLATLLYDEFSSSQFSVSYTGWHYANQHTLAHA